MNPSFDEKSGAQANIDIAHVKTHEGADFLGFNVNNALGDDAVLDIAFDVPAGLEAHIEFLPAGDGACEIWVLQGVTVSTAGTAFTAVGRYFEGSLTASSSLTLNPTLSNTGNTKLHAIVPGGTGGNSTGGQGSSRREFIVEDVDGICVFRLKNIAGAAKACGNLVDFYELTE